MYSTFAVSVNKSLEMTVKYDVAGKYLVIRLYTFQTGIQHSLCWAHTKNPFKIHKLFANLCNMVQKSNTKVRNSPAHPVKGRNPY